MLALLACFCLLGVLGLVVGWGLGEGGGRGERESTPATLWPPYAYEPVRHPHHPCAQAVAPRTLGQRHAVAIVLERLL